MGGLAYRAYMPVLVWFRRDLRLHDQTALHHAARDFPDGIVPVFIFDDAILKHPDCGAPIVGFMLGCLEDLRDQLRQAGGELLFRHGPPLKELRKLAKETGASAVYYNKDYAPSACERDDRIERQLSANGLVVRGFKDQVIFEEQEILSASKGEPYTVYTPYRKSWIKKLAATFGPLGPDPLPKPKLTFPEKIKNASNVGLPTAKALGHGLSHALAISPGESVARQMLRRFIDRSLATYPATRNFPAMQDGTSKLSPHLRHGTLSPRTCVRAALEATVEHPEFRDPADTWIGELVWREFYQQILYNFPQVETTAFKPKFAKLKWSDRDDHFAAWCQGQTGYPIVDAAMHQLNTTGWMHNRLRMISAMFLVKDLRINWQLGERYFMQHLIDSETAQNNGGWQWSASTGTDAQPYFRIFNPASQSKKFDPEGAFIRQHVPALKDVPARFIHAPQEMTPIQQRAAGCVIGQDYPPPIVDHAEARLKTLAMYKKSK